MIVRCFSLVNWAGKRGGKMVSLAARTKKNRHGHRSDSTQINSIIYTYNKCPCIYQYIHTSPQLCSLPIEVIESVVTISVK